MLHYLACFSDRAHLLDRGDQQRARLRQNKAPAPDDSDRPPHEAGRERDLAKGGAPAVTDVMKGVVDAYFDAVSSSLPRMKGGSVAVAIAGGKRRGERRISRSSSSSAIRVSCSRISTRSRRRRAGCGRHRQIERAALPRRARSGAQGSVVEAGRRSRTVDAR